MLFDQPNPAPSSETHSSRLSPRAGFLLNYAVILALISASTTFMMLCPCDSVGIHDRSALTRVAIAALFGIAAAFLIYRRMRHDLGITPFLKAIIAVAIAGFGVYVELFAVMQVVAWLAARGSRR
jgi:hypothetical protein